MARVPYPTRDEFPEAHRAAYDRMLSDRGDPPPHIFLALANIPNLLDVLLAFTGEMKHGAKIAPYLRELAIVTVGLASGTDYEVAHHWNSALKAGARRAQLEQLEDFETSAEFDAAERAVVRYARAATLDPRVPDTVWNELRAHFDVREAMDIVMATAWYNGVVRMILPLGVEIEPWCQRA
ncbi:carboxymuconolactone decarboxylase family protein [Aquabacter spiritensis]|uniref:Alkylhydroperoxidase family enzyme n=1 Tax=Aquabacter spiritensis TaxID=933073 RepID=A0A4R3M2J2_9HYPH|nr:carboxymuconolactone decarboxylase family protein [Aquabacter spiritensis]TCT05457.1 alkylhydroperoxidase family enzyme [Aquabacter spiritensis]